MLVALSAEWTVAKKAAMMVERWAEARDFPLVAVMVATTDDR